MNNGISLIGVDKNLLLKQEKEIKIKTDFIEELLYLILDSTDTELQKEVHKIGIKYDKNIQELKGDGSNE